MASDQSFVVASQLSSQVAGNTFVQQFYHILHQSPQLVHRFYQENNKLGHPDPSDAIDSVTAVQVWISYAKFEASIAMEEEDQDTETGTKNEAEHRIKCIQRCRYVFEIAFDYFRTSSPELKEERAMLLEECLNMESSFGSLGDVSIVQKKLPRKVKRKRAIQSENGNPARYEECIEYTFPDEVAMASNLKILEAAYKWKKQKAGSHED